MKVCIVGAGMAGLCAARHALQNKMNVTIYEQNIELGGTWVYTDEIGVNKYGNYVHSSMYQGLRTNLPKEIMGYPDFSIQTNSESYVPAEDILNFLQDYAKTFEITDHIKFLHHVVKIQRQRHQWQVIVKNLSTRCYFEEFFDFIMVCNGHYHNPMVPNICGMDCFEGKILHSHDYRCLDSFKELRLVLTKIQGQNRLAVVSMITPGNIPKSFSCNSNISLNSIKVLISLKVIHTVLYINKKK